MASVEEIYQKIRRGETADLKTVRASDADLEAGVERIRARMAGNLPRCQGAKPAAPRGRWLWIPAFAVASVAVVLLIWRPFDAKIQADGWMRGKQLLPLGKPVALNSGEAIQIGEKISLKALGQVQIAPLTAEREIHLIRLISGMALIERRDASLAVTLRTNLRDYLFSGTRFICASSSGEDTIFMFAGKLDFTQGGKKQSLSAAGNNLLVSVEDRIDVKRMSAVDFAARHPEWLTRLGDIAEFRNLTSPRVPRAAINPKTAFRTGECVTYYRNNEKRRGKIYAQDASGYVIHGASGPEPGHFRDGDIFRRDCAE